MVLRHLYCPIESQLLRSSFVISASNQFFRGDLPTCRSSGIRALITCEDLILDHKHTADWGFTNLQNNRPLTINMDRSRY